MGDKPVPVFLALKSDVDDDIMDKVYRVTGVKDDDPDDIVYILDDGRSVQRNECIAFFNSDFFVEGEDSTGPLSAAIKGRMVTAIVEAQRVRLAAKARKAGKKAVVAEREADERDPSTGLTVEQANWLTNAVRMIAGPFFTRSNPEDIVKKSELVSRLREAILDSMMPAEAGGGAGGAGGVFITDERFGQIIDSAVSAGRTVKTALTGRTPTEPMEVFSMWRAEWDRPAAGGAGGGAAAGGAGGPPGGPPGGSAVGGRRRKNKGRKTRSKSRKIRSRKSRRSRA